MHGDPPERLAPKIADMRAAPRAARAGKPPLQFGVAGFVVVPRLAKPQRERELARITDVKRPARGLANYQHGSPDTQLEQHVSLEDYSVSNRGLRTGSSARRSRSRERLDELERIGIDLPLLQFSPQAEEMERFAAEVIARRGFRAQPIHGGAQVAIT